MNRRIIFAFLSLALLCISESIAQPSLYGKLSLQSSEGKVIVRDANVELTSILSPKNKFSTYADAKGNFAFYKVAFGDYELMVYINKKVAQQKIDTMHIEKRTVHLTKPGKNVGEIILIN